MLIFEDDFVLMLCELFCIDTWGFWETSVNCDINYKNKLVLQYSGLWHLVMW